MSGESDHPEDVNPLGDSHPVFNKGEKRSMRVLSIGLVLGLVMVPMVAVMSDSPIANVLLGLSPFLLTLVWELIVVARHFKRPVLWLILIIVHMFALGFLYSVNPVLPSPVNVGQVVSISVLLSSVFTLLAFLADASADPAKHYRMPPPVEFTVESLPDFVQSIEDKAKGINFAIGRVYRNSNGGNAKLRGRLRIPREWYNEFTDAEEDERTHTGKIIVKKIHDRLLRLGEKESAVLHKDEMKRMKNTKRHKGSTVIDVLQVNDSDPVHHYYESALSFCEKVLEGLN